MITQTRIIVIKIRRLAGVVRRVPEAMLRALDAAIAEFIATLARPEAAEPGSAADLAEFGVQQQDLREALRMLLDDRAVRPRKLMKRFGNARGTNLLSVCEIRGFISKPEGGPWKIDLDRVRRHLAEHGAGQ